MKTSFFIFFLLCFTTFLYAQDEAEDLLETPKDIPTPMFSLGIEFDVGIPLNDFNDNLNRLTWGFSGSFLVRTNPAATVPVLLGLSGGAVFYDAEIRDQLIFIDGYTIEGRSTTRNGIFMMHGLLRLLPPVDLPVQPYIDGMFGFKNFYARTLIEELNPPDNEEALEDSYIEQGDWALSYGGAVGLQYLVGAGAGIYILLDVRCVFLKGSTADYLVRNTDPNLQIVDTIDAFEEKKSTTDMLIPQIGVSFVF
ncbi:MAG: hypothetical protein ACI8VT_003166 [Saprospiraceae bacterium]|jgi:hypothetical protein